LAYVALTRARKKINITYVNQNRYSYASHDFNKPSRFINELPKELIELNDSSFFEKNNFLDDFVQLENISNDFLTPGRKRLLKNTKKEAIDWDINQDINFNYMPQKGDRVFHQKFGYGNILFIDGDRAEVNFDKSSIKKIFLKFLQFNH